MRVGHQHGVDPRVRLGRDWRRDPPQVGDTIAQQRVGQQPRAVQLDQDRGVAEVGQPVRRYPCGISVDCQATICQPLPRFTQTST